MERLHDFIITLLTNGMSLTDVHILTEEFAFCHKTIILSDNNNKLVNPGSTDCPYFFVRVASFNNSSYANSYA